MSSNLTELKNRVQYLTDDSSLYNTQQKQKDLQNILDTFNDYHLHTKYKNKIEKQKKEVSKLNKELKNLKTIVDYSKNNLKSPESKSPESKIDESKSPESKIDESKSSESKFVSIKLPESESSELNDNESKTDKLNDDETNKDDLNEDILAKFDKLVGGTNEYNYLNYLPFLNNDYFDLFNNNFNYETMLIYIIYHILSLIEIIMIFMLGFNNINYEFIILSVVYIMIKLKFNSIEIKKLVNKHKEFENDISKIKNDLINPNKEINKNKIKNKLNEIVKYYENYITSNENKYLFYIKLVLICFPILILGILYVYTECIFTSLIILYLLLLVIPYKGIFINVFDRKLEYKTIWNYLNYLEILIIIIIIFNIVKIYSNKYTNTLDFYNSIKLLVNNLKKLVIKSNTNVLVKTFNKLIIK